MLNTSIFTENPNMLGKRQENVKLNRRSMMMSVLISENV